MPRFLGRKSKNLANRLARFLRKESCSSRTQKAAHLHEINLSLQGAEKITHFWLAKKVQEKAQKPGNYRFLCQICLVLIKKMHHSNPCVATASKVFNFPL
jgi:hypothetical protein